MNETIFEAKDLTRSFTLGRSALQKLTDKLANTHPSAALRAEFDPTFDEHRLSL